MQQQSVSREELLIYKSLSIVGPGPSQLTIDANQQSRIVEIALNATVTISGVTLFHGAAFGPNGVPDTPTTSPTNGGPAFGGAVLINSGATLALNECVVDSNTATGGHGARYSSVPFRRPPAQAATPRVEQFTTSGFLPAPDVRSPTTSPAEAPADYTALSR